VRELDEKCASSHFRWVFEQGASERCMERTFRSYGAVYEPATELSKQSLSTLMVDVKRLSCAAEPLLSLMLFPQLYGVKYTALYQSSKPVHVGGID
jgi:hypothetical protein